MDFLDITLDPFICYLFPSFYLSIYDGIFMIIATCNTVICSLSGFASLRIALVNGNLHTRDGNSTTSSWD